MNSKILKELYRKKVLKKNEITFIYSFIQYYFSKTTFNWHSDLDNLFFN